MDLIPPAEISGKIMTLIDQAQNELILISPYNKILNWKKLINRINKAQERGVSIKWYIRKYTENNAEYILKLGITPIEIENLHCKIYLNEKHAVVTSMNLHEFSDNSSLDIGYYVTEQDKYAELKEFVNTYIEVKKQKSTFETDKPIAVGSTDISFLTLLKTELKALRIENTEIDERYGGVISLKNFMFNGMELIFEPKGGYYRIDFRINQPYKQTNLIYHQLSARKQLLETNLGFEIDFGNQMKRLKFDMKIFESHNYLNWKLKEFNAFWPHALKIIHGLKAELENVLYKDILK